MNSGGTVVDAALRRAIDAVKVHEGGGLGWISHCEMDTCSSDEDRGIVRVFCFHSTLASTIRI